MTLRTRRSAVERIMDKVVENQDGCLIFTGCLSQGYGRISLGGRDGGVGQAHRVMYEALVQPIPEGWCIDHLCGQRACQNVEHMEPTTLAENTRRGADRNRKPLCPKGHDEWGKQWSRRYSSYQRVCLRCHRERERERRAQQKHPWHETDGCGGKGVAGMSCECRTPV